MKKIYEDVKKAFDSKISSKILKALGIALIVMIIFSAGVSVGFHKAYFSRDWGEHYEENFGMGRIGMMDYAPNPHGATGKIVKIEDPNFIVEDRDGIEKTVFTDDDTIIKRGRSNITTADLENDDYVITIGSPNTMGVIQAKIIRVIPSPELLK